MKFDAQRKSFSYSVLAIEMSISVIEWQIYSQKYTGLRELKAQIQIKFDKPV